MCSLALFDWFRPLVEGGSWIWLWLIFFGALINAIREHRKLCDEVRHTTGNPKRTAIRRIVFDWSLVLLSLIGALASEWSSDTSAQKIADANERAATAYKLAASANERAAILESTNLVMALRVEELRKKNNEIEERQTGRLMVDVSGMAKALEGKPKIRVEILYQDGVAESYLLAQKIKFGLELAKWNVIDLRSAREDDVSPILPQKKTIPLMVRLGAGYGGIGWAVKELPPDARSAIATDNPVGALFKALTVGGFPVAGGMPNQDPRMPDDLIRLVVGTKFW